MDNDNAASQAQFVATQQSFVGDYYCSLAALTLLVFEYAITFDREVALFWKRRASGASILFMLTRYISLVTYTVRTMFLGHWSCWSFSVLAIVAQALAYSQYIPWAAFSTLRVFALCERPYKWPVSMTVLALSSVIVVMNFSRLHWIVSFDNMVLGTSCIAFGSRLPTQEANRLFTILPRASLIASDVIVILATWHAVYWSNGMSRIGLTSGRTLSSTLLRDGTVYFGLMLIMNIITLTLTMYPTEVDALTQVSYVVEFSEPFTTILVARFLMNLQDLGNSFEATSRKWSLTKPEIPVFASRIVGPMGSSLSSDLFDEDDSQDDEHKTEEGEGMYCLDDVHRTTAQSNRGT